MKTNDIETVRSFLLEKFVAPDSRMSMSDIYKSIKDKLTEPLDESQFRAELGAAIKDKTLKEFQTRKGRYGGVSLAGSQSNQNGKIEIEDRNSNFYYCWRILDTDNIIVASKCLSVAKESISKDKNEIEFVINHAITSINNYRIDRLKIFKVISWVINK